jgi:hypothetical protein
MKQVALLVSGAVGDRLREGVRIFDTESELESKDGK